MTLRPYQRAAIDMTWDWMRKHPGNPCIELSTGSGKSHVVAEMCREALQQWPGTRIVMVTPSKELASQNASKLRSAWPNAPLGICAASLNRRETDQPITFGTIGTMYRRAKAFGHIDIAIIDECHLIDHKDEGMYRTLIAELQAINPSLRVVGLTATPYRLGHGLITDEPAIFSELIQPTSIEELLYHGYLAPLRSKWTEMRYNLAGVHRRGGDYIESELAKAVDTEEQNRAAVRATIELAEDRKHWLFFCTGVDHATHVRDILREEGVSAETLNGKTPKAEREDILRRYMAGEFKALTNVAVLTTGFDFPDIDLISMMRPTESVVLHIQTGGRGLRPKSHTDHCLFLDFAGNVSRLGPITSPITPDKAGEGGEAPTKVCPECSEIVHASVMKCPTCDHEWERESKAPKKLHDDDIMGKEPNESTIREWCWRVHESRNSGKRMLRVDYYPESFDEEKISEYICLKHDGFAQQKALLTLSNIERQSRFEMPPSDTELEEYARLMNRRRHPDAIKHKPDGKYRRIVWRRWDEPEDDDDVPF